VLTVHAVATTTDMPALPELGVAVFSGERMSGGAPARERSGRPLHLRHGTVH